jgi:hypothetical protein
MFMRKYRWIAIGSFSLGLALAAGCSDEKVEFGAADAAAASGGFDMSGAHAASGRVPAARTTATSADAGAPVDGGADPVSLPPSVSLTPAGTLLCGNHLCQCNNGIDDDGDGTADGFDVECTGGIDDDEGSFATGIPGDNRDPKWQDCFFDGNSGAGDDRCRYPTECLTGELSLDDEACAVTQACRDNCQPRTPNGCDCFGCCAVELPGGGQVNVTLSDSCSMEKIGDPAACAPCTPNPTCGNECGECELCPGKTEADLPASCHPETTPGEDPTPDPNPPSDPVDPGDPNVDPPVFSCDGLTECDEAGGCPAGEFCSMGCCLLVIR